MPIYDELWRLINNTNGLPFEKILIFQLLRNLKKEEIRCIFPQRESKKGVKLWLVGGHKRRILMVRFEGQEKHQQAQNQYLNIYWRMGCIQNRKVPQSKETRALNKTRESKRRSQKEKQQPSMTYPQPPVKNVPDTNDDDIVKTESQLDYSVKIRREDLQVAVEK